MRSNCAWRHEDKAELFRLKLHVMNICGQCELCSYLAAVMFDNIMQKFQMTHRESGNNQKIIISEFPHALQNNTRKYLSHSHQKQVYYIYLFRKTKNNLLHAKIAEVFYNTNSWPNTTVSLRLTIPFSTISDLRCATANLLRDYRLKMTRRLSNIFSLMFHRRADTSLALLVLCFSRCFTPQGRRLWATTTVVFESGEEKQL